jgi:hypothetical protein
MFGIRVISDFNREYFMGPASRNLDNVLHAGVDSLGGGSSPSGSKICMAVETSTTTTTCSSSRRGHPGPRTTPTAVPEPATLSLFGFGLVAAKRYIRRRS